MRYAAVLVIIAAMLHKPLAFAAVRIICFIYYHPAKGVR